MVPLSNDGARVPLLMVSDDNVASVAGALVTITVYVFVEPFCAVTTALMVLAPAARLIAPEALPEVTGIPFTVTVALSWFTVGVSVIAVVLLGTLAV